MKKMLQIIEASFLWGFQIVQRIWITLILSIFCTFRLVWIICIAFYLLGFSLFVVVLEEEVVVGVFLNV